MRVARTPGAAFASVMSIETMRACGCGERTTRAKSIPGRLMSKLYLARPVTLSGPSRRLTRVLSTAGFAGHAYFFAFAVGPVAAGGGAGFCALATGHPQSKRARRQPLVARAERGFLDADERAAAADVAVESLLDLFDGRLRHFLEQRDRRHHEARRAEAAHQRVAV